MSRRWKWVAAVLVTLMVVPFVGSLLYHKSIRWSGEARLRQAEANLDRADPGWRLDDVVATHSASCPPDDQNLTKLCWDVHQARPAAYDKWTASRGKWLAAPEMNRLPGTDALEEARIVYAEAERAVDQARTARQRPRGGWRLVIKPNPMDTSLEHTQRVRTVANLLELDAVLAATGGDLTRATDSTADLLHLCHAVGDEPLLISQLVRQSIAGIAVNAAERMVGWGAPPADKLAALQNALLVEADFPRLARAFRGERAFFHRLFGSLDDKRVALNQISGDPDQTLSGLAWWRFAAHLPDERAYCLDFLTHLIAVAALPSHKQVDELEALEQPPKEPGSMLTRLTLPAVDKVTRADWRINARLRSAAVGLACERFRQANGRWPADLAELKGLLLTIPLDPYDGQPLRYRKLADGVVVYAVGPDRTDDGGTLSYGNPEPGEDIGFRLWDVAARRQPAPKEEP